MNVAVTSPSFSKHIKLREAIKSLGVVVKFNDGKHLKDEELQVFLTGTDIAVVGLEEIGDLLLSCLPRLKFIAKYGVGLDNIDLEACKKRGVKIGWNGGVNRLSVSELALSNMISLCRNISVGNTNIKNGIWDKNGGFNLSGKTVGIIGFGNIGRELVRLLGPFQCNILINDIIDVAMTCSEYGVNSVSKDVIYSKCDLISVHTPLNESTSNMINIDVIAKMKDGVFLINTARAGIINEDDLLASLKAGKVGGAALDVFNNEPNIKHELAKLSNVICTPHIGGNSDESILAMGMSAIEHIKRFLND